MFRSKHLLASLGSALVLVLSLVAAGCADDEVSTPRVTFESDIKAGTHTVQECGQSGIFLVIGSFGNPALGREDPANPESPLKDPVRPVEDGAPEQQGSVALTCSVTSAGDGFNVAASAQLTGATGGSVTITGVIKPNVDNPNITMSLTRKGETFSDKNCTVRFDTVVGHAVAGGRLWASIDCPNAERPSAQQICATHAQFRFENCAQ
jgi:hypothetical protein